MDKVMLLNYEKYDFTPPWEKRTPVILIHGLGASTKMWFYQIAELVRFFPVITLDLPGFGKSKAASCDLTIEYMAKSVHETLSHIGVEKAHVAGISLGGLVSLEVASSYPDIVDKLALISTPYTFINDNLEKNKELVKSYSKMDLKEVAARRIHLAFSADAKKEVLDYLAGIISKSDPSVYIASAGATLKYYSHEKFKRVKSKTLILISELDYIATLSDGEKIKKEIKDSELVILKNTGHASCLDNPSGVNKELLSFLK